MTSKLCGRDFYRIPYDEVQEAELIRGLTASLIMKKIKVNGDRFDMWIMCMCETYLNFHNIHILQLITLSTFC